MKLNTKLIITFILFFTVPTLLVVGSYLVLRYGFGFMIHEEMLNITDEYKEIAEKAYQVANRTLMESLRGLSIREIKICQEVLRKVFENAAG